MKKLIITCTLVTIGSMVSFAQDNAASNAAASAPQANSAPQNRPTPEQMAERRAKMFQEQLGLSDEQYKGAYAVELDFMQQMQQLHSSGAQPNRDNMMQMQTTKDQKYKQLLTPDQYTKYEAGRPKMGTNAPQSAAQGVAPKN